MSPSFEPFTWNTPAANVALTAVVLIADMRSAWFFNLVCIIATTVNVEVQTFKTREVPLELVLAAKLPPGGVIINCMFSNCYILEACE